MDEETGEILVAVVTTNDYHDSEVLPDLLDGIEADTDQVSGDGGYDTFNCYEAMEQRPAKGVIPPCKDAKIHHHGTGLRPAQGVRKAKRHPHDQNLRRIRKVGRNRWKRESGYRCRSIAETTMFRLKVIFGGKLRSRQLANQAVE